MLITETCKDYLAIIKEDITIQLMPYFLYKLFNDYSSADRI